MTEKSRQKKPYPLGAHIEGGGVRFSFVSRAASCGVLLYDGAADRPARKIPFTEEDRVGHVYCRTVEDIDTETCTYLFYEGERPVADERGRAFPKRIPYGKERKAEDMKAGFLRPGFDWKGDACPRIPYHEALVYCMHVRGFTRHASSQVAHRGTFAGIGEKIPYLKEIGVTTIELQPAYEFAEASAAEEPPQAVPYGGNLPGENPCGRDRLNYWGYKKGFYYAPKAAYASAGDGGSEFKELVRALHENGMELVMQFYFPEEARRSEILDILCFWVLEYHVDGFHLLGENLPVDMLAADEALADTKLWYGRFDTDRIYAGGEQPLYPHAAEYNDAWYYDMRRFLKGDGNMLGSVLYHMRYIPRKAGAIHYLTNYSGFTLADLVSYDYKHNEANGEDNKDGSDYNCSWNCGEEGATRKRNIKALRLKQMKNAMCLLLLAQSTPLIFMGDEFGNSQKGNNNPYCQDNAVAWLDWNGIRKNAELHRFWKMLVAFRKRNPILHPAKKLRLMDYIACGYPDLSYHGQYAWQAQTEGNVRHIGIMLCGKYARSGAPGEDAFLYLAMNMHWEDRALALPKLPKDMRWEPVFSTELSGEPDSGQKAEPAEKGKELLREIPPRSIAVYRSVPCR